MSKFKLNQAILTQLGKSIAISVKVLLKNKEKYPMPKTLMYVYDRIKNHNRLINKIVLGECLPIPIYPFS